MTCDDARYRRALLALVLLAAVLRLTGLNWDAGRGLHPDEGNLIRAALTLGVDGRFLPEFHAYNDFALWLPRLLSLPVCEAQDAACLTLVARLVSALASLAMVPLGAGIARRIAGNGAGLAAGLVLATSGALVQWAHFGTTESVMALLVVLLWALAVRHLAGAMTERDLALWSALALGISFGFKTTAVVFSAIPLMALALAGRPDAARLRAVALMAAIALFQAAVFAPSVIFATGDWLGVMRFENDVVTGALPVFWTAQFHGATDGVFEMRQMWSLTMGAGLLLALVAVADRSLWRLAAPGLAFVLLYAALTFGWHAKFVRYLAPVLPVLLILAGVGLARLLAQPWRSVQAAGLAGLGLMGLAGLDHASAYLRPDPRLVMEARLLDLASPGDAVAVEPYDLGQVGGLPTVLLPLADPAATPQAMAEALAQSQWVLIASRRNWSVLPRQPGAAPVVCATYAGLSDGALGFFPVARTDRLGLFGRLFAPGLSAEETREVFDRPEVFLFRNIERLPVGELANRLSTPREAAACAAPALQQSWRRGA